MTGIMRFVFLFSFVFPGLPAPHGAAAMAIHLVGHSRESVYMNRQRLVGQQGEGHLGTREHIDR